jgi:hypothetical protein
MQFPAIPLHSFKKRCDKGFLRAFRPENIMPVIASIDYMVSGIRILDSQCARHKPLKIGNEACASIEKSTNINLTPSALTTNINLTPSALTNKHQPDPFGSHPSYNLGGTARQSKNQQYSP